MPYSSRQSSQEYLLLPRPSDDSESAGFRSPSPLSNDDGIQIKSPNQGPLGLLEPMTMDEPPLRQHRRPFLSRLRTSFSPRRIPQRTDARFALCPDGCGSRWLPRSFGRRPRASRFILYLIIGY